MQPLKGGTSDGISLSLDEVEEAKAVYYAMAGWDQQGRPTAAKLHELGLGWAVDELS